MISNPRCAVCGQPAAVHETTLRSGRVQSRSYCAAHGAPRLPKIEEPQAREEVERQLRAMSPAELQQLAAWHRAERRGR